MSSPSVVEDVEDSLVVAAEPLALRPPELAGGSLLQGHLPELAGDNLGLFQRCAALGGLVRFRVYWYTCHVLSDPELVGDLLVTHAASFKKTRALQVARPTFGNGLVTSEGETWRRQQRLLRTFFTPKAAAGYAQLIGECIERKLDTRQIGSEVDLHQDMIDVSLEIVCRALFGLEAGRLQPLIRDAAHAVQQWHSDAQDLCLPYPHYFPSRANFRYRMRSRALDRAVYQLIGKARRSKDDQHGLLGTLLAMRDEDGSAITDQEVRDQVVTLFLAGHDTTASSLAFTLYELAYRPDLQARIALESETSGESLDHCLKETLRLYPAVHLVARTALEDVKLGPYLVKRGEEVVLPLSVLQRHPRLFEQADEFVPERWAAAQPLSHRHAYLPFSTGPRVCIGQAMAMAELRGVVSAVMRRFQLSPTGARGPKLANRMTLGPAEGAVRCRVEARGTFPGASVS